MTAATYFLVIYALYFLLVAVPHAIQYYQSLNTPLPLLTRLFIECSQLCRGLIILIVPCLLISFAASIAALFLVKNKKVLITVYGILVFLLVVFLAAGVSAIHVPYYANKEGI